MKARYISQQMTLTHTAILNFPTSIRMCFTGKFRVQILIHKFSSHKVTLFYSVVDFMKIRVVQFQQCLRF